MDKENAQLEIMPCGWIKSLILESGKWRCGRAFNGIEVHLRGEAGGVISLDDALRIKEFIEDHLRFLAGEERGHYYPPVEEKHNKFKKNPKD